jgi:hypothetical protein
MIRKRTLCEEPDLQRNRVHSTGNTEAEGGRKRKRELEIIAVVGGT